MGRRDPRELGNRRPAVRRVGVDGFPLWGGMYLLGDPGSVPPNRFTYAQNVRFRGPKIIDRAGVSAVNQSGSIDSATACINSLADFQTGASRKIYCVFDGCPGVSSSVGFSLNWFDWEQQEMFSRGVYYNASTTNLCVGSFSGRLYLGLDNTLKLLKLIIPPYGTEALSVSGTKQDEDIYAFPAGWVIRWLLEFDSKLFIGVDDGAGNGEIWTWNGLTMLRDITGINKSSNACLWRDKLVVGFATSGIKIRAAGGSPGSYSSVAGAVVSVEMTSYRDAVYITNGLTAIWKYDGTALASTHTIAGATIFGLAGFNGYLYYGYKSAGNHALIGRYDGAAFTDAHKDLTSQLAGARTPRVLADYRGSLVAGVLTVAAGAQLFVSPTTATSGTYTQITPNVANNGGIDQMAVF